jgi:pimeloyl-ACP methyl ester carboxylesterase
LDFASTKSRTAGLASLGSAGVPVRGISARPLAASPTAIEMNRKYADYNATLMDGVGRFLQLEKPQEFNAICARFAAELSK